VNIVGGSNKARAFYKSLPTNSRLKNEIDEALELLKFNANIGNSIEKKKIPKEYRKEYDLNNLFRHKLGDGYRLLYTILSDKKVKTCSVIEIMSHDDYEKIFGYGSD
jgi:mRNA-degrading endonuclease RelE of RelBE toxin-antitoxin system